MVPPRRVGRMTSDLYRKRPGGKHSRGCTTVVAGTLQTKSQEAASVNCETVEKARAAAAFERCLAASFCGVRGIPG
jgi:hypothetical protein